VPSFPLEASPVGLRLAGHTYAFRDRPLEAALDELVRIGFSRVEVWLGHVRDAERAGRALRERGLVAPALSAGGYYATADDATRAFEVARAVGASVVVACVAPSLLGRVAAHADERVALCIENHWDQPLATEFEVLRALEPLADVSACLDTGHALLAGAAPEHFARRLGSRLGHVHLKDARKPSSLERVLGRRVRRRLFGRPDPVRPGDGALDVARLRRALRDIAYDGVVTVEHEGPDAAEALRILRRSWESAADG
jgi:sugar phosphate isomerase/epimerase